MKYLTFLTIFLFSTAIYANPPTGLRTQIDNETYECFDLSGYKYIISLYEENKLLKEETDKLQHINIIKDNIILDQKEIIKNQEEQLKILKDSNDWLFDQWAQENKKRHEYQSIPKLSWTGWILTGTLAASTAILAGVVIADRW